MCINKLYDKIIRNSKEAEKRYLSIVSPKLSFSDAGVFLRSLSDETLLKECKARNLDVKYSEETELAYRLNWVMQDYIKAGKDKEEQEHRFKCYQLFWDALEDSMFFEQKEQKPAEWNPTNEDVILFNKAITTNANLTPSERAKLDIIRMKFKHCNGNITKPAEWSKKDESMYTRTMGVLGKCLIGELPKECKEELEWLRDLPTRFNLQPKQEWSDSFEEAVADLIERAKQGKCDSLSPIEEGNKLLAIAKHGKVNQQEWSEDWREEDIQTRFAFYTYKDEDEDGVLYLSNVFVEEASRNHGFGTKILRAAEKVAETIGATTISLKVKQDSPANAWYRKNGYGYVAFEDGYDWLEKNLEYMKPNKQEWSERDKAWLSEVYDAINHSIYSEDEKQAMKKYIDSLRSFWKPSKAQMGALKQIVDQFRPDKELESLFNDLKKLTDE